MNMTIQKQNILDAIVAKLTQELDILIQSAKAAHEAATHEESRAEDHHDTRGLEASYLAQAQGKRIEDLEQQIAFFRNATFREFKPNDAVDVGALIELEILPSRKRSFYFLLNHGGGLSVSVDGRTIQIITPNAPLGEALLDKKVDDEIEVEGQGVTREYSVKNLG